MAAPVDKQWPETAARGLRRYVQLVAEAVGSGPNAWCCEVDARPTAYIAIEGRVPRYPGRDVALLWDARNGWAAGIETASTEDLIIVAYLGNDVLPAPRLIARQVDELLAGAMVEVPEPPYFRIRGADDGLGERLADYAARPQPWKMPRPVGSA